MARHTRPHPVTHLPGRNRRYAVSQVTVHPAGAGESPRLGEAGTGGCTNAYLVPSPEDLEAIRGATLCLINREREAHGEGTLRVNGALERAAQGHSVSMVEDDYFEHVGPSGSTPTARLKAAGYIYSSQIGYAIGENIAWGTMQLATPKAIVDAWIASPGHLANILDPRFRESAIGVVPAVPSLLAHGQQGAIYTEDFGVIVTG